MSENATRHATRRKLCIVRSDIFLADIGVASFLGKIIATVILGFTISSAKYQESRIIVNVDPWPSPDIEPSCWCTVRFVTRL